MTYLETLEGRRFFSVTITQDAPFILNVAVNGYARVEETAPKTFAVFGSADDANPLGTYSGIDTLIVQGGRHDDEIVVTMDSSQVFASIDGGKGSDAITVTDTAFFTASPITVSGGNGNDLITVVRGNKTKVFGEKGDDTIVVLAGSATVDGGNGHDAVTFSGVGTTVTVVPSRGSDTVNGGIA
ncbi:MAG TPA: hypothetical protein VF796_04735 [Humisphaera sp.]